MAGQDQMYGCHGMATGHEEETAFSIIDYSVLGAVLFISCSIGIFYGHMAKKNSAPATADDFLLGGGGMGTIPMAFSLGAGFITAIELLGNPAEMYTHGSQFWMICFSFLFVIPIASYLYLPVFMKLRLTSCYEYLELRFNKSLRIVAASLYILQMVLYTSVAVYAPALALSHVTGLNTYLAVTIVYAVCIFYASQGGMKAVIIADSFQAAVLILSILLVMVLGDIMAGGTKRVFDLSIQADKIELFNINFDPRIRHSLWSVVIGGTFYWAAMFCTNQASIQKCLSVDTIYQVRRAFWGSAIGLIFVFTINFYTGMILFAEYQHCDPVESKVISGSDELLVLYIMQVQGHYSGLPGLFVSGIFAASLGTVASGINSLAAVCLMDLLGSVPNPFTSTPARSAKTAKYLSILFGVLSFSLVFIVQQLGALLQVALSFNGITGGVTLGLFSLGMFFPWANSKGALVGSLTGFALVGYIGLAAQLAQVQSDHTLTHNSTSVNFTVTDQIDEFEPPQDEPFALHQLSYMWYTGLGAVVTFVVGVFVSLLSDSDDAKKVDSDYLSPPINHIIKRLPDNIKDKLGLSTKKQEFKPPTINTISSEFNGDIITKSPEKPSLQEENGGYVNHALDLESESKAPVKIVHLTVPQDLPA